MKFLVTGGMGFIGNYVVAYAREKHDICIFDLKNRIDILKIPLPFYTANEYDAIIHLAAQLEILDIDPRKEAELNIKGTINMLEYCRICDVPKFVYASSVAVYGEPKFPSEETDELKPFWSYGSSKVAGETYCKQYEELYGIKTISIRPAIVTGVGEWYGRFITLSLARIKKKEPILVFGDGSQTRDFVDVRDCAQMFLKAVEQNIKTPEVFNCGSSSPRSIEYIANFLSKLSGAKIEYINPKVGELGRKPHELQNMWLQIQHARKILNWFPIYHIEETLDWEYSWIRDMDMREFREWSKQPRY